MHNSSCVLPFASATPKHPIALSLIYRPWRDGRLSWPTVSLVRYRERSPVEMTQHSNHCATPPTCGTITTLKAFGIFLLSRKSRNNVHRLRPRIVTSCRWERLTSASRARRTATFDSPPRSTRPIHRQPFSVTTATTTDVHFTPFSLTTFIKIMWLH